MKQLILAPGSRKGDRVELRDRDHHYLARVRRVAVGDTLSALDGDARLVLEVVEVGSSLLTLRVVESVPEPKRAATRVVLFPFLLKARKLDDVVRQAGEAGVSAVVPVIGDHCVAKPGDHQIQRWAAIAREAAQQSGSAPCEVGTPIASRAVAEQWAAAGPLLFFHQVPLATGSLHRQLSPCPEAVGLVVGPEGGLSPAEVDVLRAAGAKPVWLGPSVLRAETASLYAIAAVNTILQETLEWTIRT